MRTAIIVGIVICGMLGTQANAQQTTNVVPGSLTKVHIEGAKYFADGLDLEKVRICSPRHDAETCKKDYDTLVTGLRLVARKIAEKIDAERIGDIERKNTLLRDIAYHSTKNADMSAAMRKKYYK